MKKIALKQNIEIVHVDDNGKDYNVKSTQEVSVETESDGIDWVILTHDNEEFSLSLENLKSLGKLIENAIQIFENSIDGARLSIDENNVLTEIQ